MPRRRSRRPNYGGGTGFCGCCNYWNQDEEEVAQEYIKRRAKGSFAGKLICCDCDRGYDRHNVKRLYIFAGILFGLLLIITMSYSGSVYKPAQHIATFKKAECRVSEIVYNKNLTSSCRWSEKRSNGHRVYRCLRIFVTFKPKDNINGSRTPYQAILADGYTNLKLKEEIHEMQCTTKPGSCSRHGDLEAVSDKLHRYYRDVIADDPFKCLYNPEDPEQVIPPIFYDLSKAKSYVVMFSFFTTAFGLLLVFMCCTCGCQYVCASRVPLEITQEVQKRRAENQGLTAGDPSAGGGNIIYVGQPMQMVPATGIQPPPMAGPQPLPMQQGQPPMGPQYGQYPPQAPQPGYPAPQPGYPAPQPGYGPPPPAYGPPPQPGYGPPAPMPGQYPPQQGATYPPPQGVAYPPQGGAYPPPPQAGPPGYAPSGPPPPVGATAPPAHDPNAIPYNLNTGGAYQHPTYTGISGEAGELPPKPPMQ